jgi:hypothetical protein
VSNKRDKNARKKVVQKKRPAVRAAGPVPIDKPAARIQPDWDAEFVEPETAVAPKGGGAIGRLRTTVAPGRGKDGTSLLTKRRSVPELMLWLLGAVGIGWALWTLFGGPPEAP